MLTPQTHAGKMIVTHRLEEVFRIADQSVVYEEPGTWEGVMGFSTGAAPWRWE